MDEPIAPEAVIVWCARLVGSYKTMKTAKLKQSNSQLNQSHKKKMKDVSLTTMEVGIALTISMGFLL